MWGSGGFLARKYHGGAANGSLYCTPKFYYAILGITFYFLNGRIIALILSYIYILREKDTGTVRNMDIVSALSNSFDYAKEAVWEKWVKWILLLVCTILFPLLYGYLLEIFRGKKPAPELNDYVKLFIDGLMYMVIGIIYMIPVIIVFCIFLLPAIPAILSGSPQAMMLALGSAMTGVAIATILAFILALFSIIGVIRFARTGKMGEAFNFNAILATIGKIGWVSYIISLIVLVVVMVIVAGILSLIPIIGQLLTLILAPAIAIFEARYLTLLYDSAGPAPAA